MNKVFCVSCGFKNVYEVTKPKFCASCGTPVAGGVAPTPAAAVKAEVEVEYKEESSLGSIDLRKLRQDIVAETNTQKMTLTDLWKSATPEDANMTPMQRRASNLPDGKELLKRSQADCSSAREATEIDG